MAIEETSGCIFEDLPEFLDTIFPLAQLADGEQAGKDLVQRFVDKFLQDGLLKPSKWVKIPDEEFAEKDLLAPIVKVLNSITEWCGAEKRINWLDSHDKPPQATYVELLRPDLFAMLDHAAGSPTHWHKMLVPIEVKKRSRPADALPQLLTYARTALRMQWNHRFLFGLIFAGTYFQVWLFDRAGAIASPKINFHLVRMSLVAVSTSLTQVSCPTGTQEAHSSYCRDSTEDPASTWL